jgi:hypothetical protein
MPRHEVDRMQNGSLKMMPYDRLFGTLKSMGMIYENSPMDTHPQGTMTLLRRKYSLGGMWFLDNWPASAVPQLCIADPVGNALFHMLSQNLFASDVSRSQMSGIAFIWFDLTPLSRP